MTHLSQKWIYTFRGHFDGEEKVLAARQRDQEEARSAYYKSYICIHDIKSTGKPHVTLMYQNWIHTLRGHFESEEILVAA